MTFSFVRCVVAALAIFLAAGLVYTASFLLIPLEIGPWQAEHGRPPGDPLRTWGLVGHALQAVALALVYFLLVRSRRLSAGLLFGLLTAVYLSATELTVLAAFRAASAPFTLIMIPVNLVVGLVSGWLLAVLYPSEGVRE